MTTCHIACTHTCVRHALCRHNYIPLCTPLRNRSSNIGACSNFVQTTFKTIKCQRNKTRSFGQRQIAYERTAHIIKTSKSTRCCSDRRLSYAPPVDFANILQTYTSADKLITEHRMLSDFTFFIESNMSPGSVVCSAPIITRTSFDPYGGVCLEQSKAMAKNTTILFFQLFGRETFSTVCRSQRTKTRESQFPNQQPQSHSSACPVRDGSWLIRAKQKTAEYSSVCCGSEHVSRGAVQSLETKNGQVAQAVPQRFEGHVNTILQGYVATPVFKFP